MLDWSSHLPRLGALVVSAAVALGAHGVYSSQSNTSATDAGESIAGLPSQPDAAGAGPLRDGRQEPARERPDRRAVGGAGELPGPTAGGPAVSSVAPAPSDLPRVEAVDRELRQPQAPDAAAPEPSPNPDDDGSLDGELQDLIDTGLPVAPDEQPTDPAAPMDPGVPELDVPAPDEDPDATPAPPAPPASPADPDEPAEPAQPVDPADGAEPADADAALDDTAVGGLDETDLGTPVDEADQGATTTPPAAGSPPAADSAAPADAAPSAGAAPPAASPPAAG